MTIRVTALLATIAALALACGADESPEPTAAPPPAPAPPPQAAAPTTPDSLPNGIMLALAQFVSEKDDAGKSSIVPGPARAEFLFRRDGQWQTTALEDPDSNVFHKAMVYPSAAPVILTLGGSAARVRSWARGPGGLEATTLWEKDFGGKFSRMRDAEVGDLYGDGRMAIAVSTHDQGVVAVLRPGPGGDFEVQELDRWPDTFVHEIEIGDMNGDGTLEVYATPSEPNTLRGDEQHGTVVRYVPKDGRGRTVVADLGNRHAKEIFVGDVDGDGTDELYVAVEALTEGVDPNVTIVEPVEIRRYDARAASGEECRGGGADPAAGTGDDRDLSRKIRFRHRQRRWNMGLRALSLKITCSQKSQRPPWRRKRNT